MGKADKNKQAVIKKRKFSMEPTRIIAIVFAAIILTGTLLLTLPAASQSRQSAGFLPSLFTATSATCVTGLVIYDTGTQWSLFGQIVILCLIEVGGLGFMSMASLVIFLLRRKVGLRQRMVMAQALSVNDMNSVVRLQKWVLFGSLFIQLAGAMVLFFHFLPKFGPGQAAYYGVFHAISAFCNAGFDIFGYGNSIVAFNGDAVLEIVLMVLISVGGLGFFDWEEVVRLHSWKKFSVYTKLVLLASLMLTVGGALVFLGLEWNNPGTMGGMSAGNKILNAFFQSVTVRTAGFAAMEQGLLTDGGKAVAMVLMLIGGSSGSTAGGIKTVTVMVLMLFIWSRVRGKNTVRVFKRTVPDKQVMDAMTVAGIVFALAVFGGIFLCATCPVSFVDGLYETVSALATVGLTAGATPKLAVVAQLLIILYMYFGRVGVLTISLGFLMGDRAEERYRYAETNLLIG